MSNDFDDVFQNRGGWAQRVSEPRVQPEAVEQRPEPGAYRAFGYTPTDDLETCDIAWWLGGDTPQGQEIQYRFLVRVGYFGDECLQLMLTDAMIVIEGKNLRELRKRLTRAKVTFIQAFNPRIWPKPPEGEAIVEKVSLLYPGEARAPANSSQ